MWKRVWPVVAGAVPHVAGVVYGVHLAAGAAIVVVGHVVVPEVAGNRLVVAESCVVE